MHVVQKRSELGLGVTAQEQAAIAPSGLRARLERVRAQVMNALVNQ
jgi:hypothetical protein